MKSKTIFFGYHTSQKKNGKERENAREKREKVY